MTKAQRSVVERVQKELAKLHSEMWKVERKDWNNPQLEAIRKVKQILRNNF